MSVYLLDVVQYVCGCVVVGYNEQWVQDPKPAVRYEAHGTEPAVSAELSNEGKTIPYVTVPVCVFVFVLKVMYCNEG